MNYLYVSSSAPFVSFELFARKAGENSFCSLKTRVVETKDVEEESNGYYGESIEVDSSWEYTDYAVLFTNELGYSFKGDPISVVVENGCLCASYGTDTDKDGVTDAYEVWLSGTNPSINDSFPDAKYYVYYTDGDETTCYDRLMRRDVSVSTADYTKVFFYGSLDYPGRLSKTEVIYKDGSKKEIRYEYEGDVLVNLYVGDTKYTIKEDENLRAYYVNGALVKSISKESATDIIDYLDTTKEVYVYDEDSNLVSYQNGNLYEMTYDDLGLLVGMSKNGLLYGSYSYDDYGNYITIDASDYFIHYTLEYPKYVAEYSYGDVQKKQELSCKKDGYASGDIITLTDGTEGNAIPNNVAGKITETNVESKTMSFSIGDEIHTVQYDNRGYVIKNTVISSLSESLTTYAYDSYGNLLSVTTKKDGIESTQTYEYSDRWSDVLTTFDGKTITYDVAGKPSKYYDGSEFSWTAGKLAMVKKGQNRATYSYNFEGLRDEKTVNGSYTKYIYEGSDLIAELGDDSLYYTYDGNFNLVGFEWNEENYYYQYDFLGDVIAIVDADGETCCTYSYDIWGAIQSVTGDETLAKRNPIRYRGYYYDEETGFYYLETRYYDSNTKRFLTYDDFESFLYDKEENIDGLYVYCGNNPVLFDDSTGKRAFINEVFTISEFKKESNDVRNSLNSTLVSMGHTTNTYVFEFKTTAAFISEWNKMSAKDVVVINVHGNASAIGNKNDSVADIRIQDLQYNMNNKTIVVLYLLGCHCGEYTKRNNNIARAFAKKINGTVIASDGNVNRAFLSDASFKAGGSGWYSYKFINYGSTFTCVKLGYTKLSIRQMLYCVGFH